MCGYPLFYLEPGIAISHEGIAAVDPTCAYMWVCEVYAQVGSPVSYEQRVGPVPGASFFGAKMAIFGHLTHEVGNMGLKLEVPFCK